MKSRGLLASLLFLAGSLNAQAYVTYNRLGYVSCTACHYDSLGGGALSSYGQSVQAAMSALPAEFAADENPVTAGVQARVIALDETTGANPFVMQADLFRSASLSKKIRLDAQLGPNFKQGKSEFASLPSGWDALALRRALISVELTETGSISFGRDAAISGINTDDHTAFLRSKNNRGVFDYPTQIRYLFQGDRWQLLPYVSLPTFEEEESNREYGTGVRGEYLLDSSNSIGALAYYGNSPSTTRMVGSAFFRLSAGHWNGLAGELIWTHFNSHSLQTGIDQQTIFLKPYIAIPEWLETSFVYEFLHSSDPFYETGFQYGPELNARIHRFVSIIGDGRNLGISGNTNWSWYAQVFLHLQI